MPSPSLSATVPATAASNASVVAALPGAGPGSSSGRALVQEHHLVLVVEVLVGGFVFTSTAMIQVFGDRRPALALGRVHAQVAVGEPGLIDVEAVVGVVPEVAVDAERRRSG